MAEKEIIIGIDLGTSNSAACVYKDGQPTMIPSAEGVSMYGKAFPSYVAFTEDGKRLVGEPAKRQAETNPKNTISEIKRRMGKDYKVNIQGKDYTPQEISAMLLQKIKRDAETFLGQEVNKAVITVPAYFDDNQRTATKVAGKIAGLDVLNLVNEPTAASLAYGLDKQEEDEAKILVFDLGGGTLDVTIMEFGGGVFNVCSTSGDTNLGGTDMDNILIKYLTDEFLKETGIKLEGDEAQRRLRLAAEKAKIELSTMFETTVNVPFIAMGDDGPKNLIKTINRSKLESLVNPIIKRCAEPIDQALSDADLTVNDIDNVILVGGPTRMPSVQDFVEKHIGKPVERGIDPMECVAQGASIQSGVLSGEITGIVLVDVTPLSLGTVVLGEITSVLIERNSPIPVKKSDIFTTVEDNQTSVRCEVVQGEHKMANKNTELGSFLLDGIPPMRRGLPQIEVTFEIDNDGILNVTAKELSTGKEQSITITSANKLSQAEIDRMTKEAEENARQDEFELKLAQTRNEANNAILTAKDLIYDSNLNIDEDSRLKIEDLIVELQTVLLEEDVTEIKFKIKDLNETVADVGSTLY